MSSSFRSPVPGKGARLSYFVPGPVAVAAKGISHGNARKGMDDKNSAKPEPILLRVLKLSVCFRVIPWPSPKFEIALLFEGIAHRFKPLR